MFVYAMRGAKYVKIGVSDDIEKRLASFNRGTLPFPMKIICLSEADTVRALEAEFAILGRLPGRLLGEWAEGSITDAELEAAFRTWPWRGPVLVNPSDEQIMMANRSTRMHRQLEAARAVARARDEVMPKGVDWHKIATQLVASGETGALRKVRKAFKSKRLAAQRKVAI